MPLQKNGIPIGRADNTVNTWQHKQHPAPTKTNSDSWFSLFSGSSGFALSQFWWHCQPGANNRLP